MRALWCTVLVLFLWGLLCGSTSQALPRDWAWSWVRNLRVIITYKLPYKWGGESSEEGGYDCTGFLYAGSPEYVRNRNLLVKLKSDLVRSKGSVLKRSTSSRMERGLDGWDSVPVSEWDLQDMDLGFIDGHAIAVAEGKIGVYVILHSRSSTGPIEEPLPNWIRDKRPRFRRLTIGDKP